MEPIPILTVQPANNRGGVPVQHINFLRAIDPNRFAMHVVIEQAHAMEREYAEVSASITTLPETPLMPRSLSPMKLSRYVWKTREMASEIARIAKHLDARAIYCFSELFPAPLIAAQRLGLPAAVHILAMSVFQPPWVGKFWARWILDRADRIIGCQQRIAQHLHRAGIAPEKVRVVYNGIDPRAIRQRAAEGPAPRLDANRLGVAMIGRMDRRKGHLNFFQAAMHVHRQMPHVDFYCLGDTAGDDAYLKEIRTVIEGAGLSDRCHLLGHVPNSSAWLKAMDVYCTPSLSEALSVAGLEAMALGKPVVATRVGGNPEAVADGETGLICEPADPEDLGRKLLALLNDQPLRDRFGRAGRERVEERFTAQSSAAALEAVFHELIEASVP